MVLIEGSNFLITDYLHRNLIYIHKPGGSYTAVRGWTTRHYLHSTWSWAWIQTSHIVVVAFICSIKVRFNNLEQIPILAVINTNKGRSVSQPPSRHHTTSFKSKENNSITNKSYYKSQIDDASAATSDKICEQHAIFMNILFPKNNHTQFLRLRDIIFPKNNYSTIQRANWIRNYQIHHVSYTSI